MSADSPLVLLPHRFLYNIYIRELGRSYTAAGCRVVYGPENLFESNLTPDILHVHWPEELRRGSGVTTRSVRNGQLLDRLDVARMEGALVAWTIHNEEPHESSNRQADHSAYQGLFDRTDIVHHHCECSLEAIHERYEVHARTREFVAPHGHYHAYPNTVTRAEARRELGLGPEAFVYLHFGAIRGYKGLEQVFDAFRKVRGRDCILLVAGRAPGEFSLASRLRLGYHKRAFSRVKLHIRPIRNDEIQVFFNAADAVVLGHRSGLNSGIAVLAMSFGKPVIGPSMGCLSWVLGQGVNLTYDVNNSQDFVDKLLAARKLLPDEIARVNVAATERWGWERISQPVIEAWRERSET